MMRADVGLEDSLFPGPYCEKNAQLFMQNSCLFDKIKEIESQVDKMHVHWRKLRSIESLKKKQRQERIQKGEVVKRKRRKAKGIQRRYACPVQECGKSYGSDGSLNQHIRLKHPLEFDEFRKLKFQSVIASSYE